MYIQDKPRFTYAGCVNCRIHFGVIRVKIGSSNGINFNSEMTRC